jgi:hypothetical protein
MVQELWFHHGTIYIPIEIYWYFWSNKWVQLIPQVLNEFVEICIWP